MNSTLRLATLPMLCTVFLASAAHATSDDELARRLAPVGQVCVQGQPCGEPPASRPAVTARDPAEVVARHCQTCHGMGLLNAPKPGDTVAWQALAERNGGLDGLLARAISGVNAMPARGTCGDCSDDDLRNAIKQMSGL
ncbi:c-type cytochrome [Pseudomonas entomophila]|uniref:c-type cytochrome n=1 Tax=Pseudomonas entomophila TaxID=312306 RepID=UPI0035C0E4FC